jgi:predicted NBD/HSP70 family sugar kinase
MKRLGIPKYLDGRNGDKAFSKAINRARLLDILRGRGEASRAFLARDSGLNKATVSSQIGELIDLGIVREIGTCESSMGRRPVMIEIDGSTGYALGISVSTASLHVVVCNVAGAVASDETLPLTDHTPEAVAAAIKTVIKSIRRRYGKARFGLYGVGIAVPGTVDRSTGTVVRSAKLGWENAPLGKFLEGGSFPGLSVGNDAMLACIAEHELFAPEVEDFVCLLVDEGIGSGAYLNGSPYFGSNGQFGEVGHMTIVQGGERCPCGNIGCWDLYGSELSLRQALGAARAGAAPASEELTALATDLPAWSRKTFSRFVNCHISGVTSIVNAMAPSVVVVNSSVFSASPEMFERLKAGVAARALSRSDACDIRLSSLCKTAPAIGAALAVTDRFFEDLVLHGSSANEASLKALKNK